MSSAKLALDPANLRVDEYSTAQGRVFSIYLAGRHFKRFTSKGETASPTWVKQGLSGESSLVSPENEKRLEEIHSRRNRFQTVRRFSRQRTDVPLCLEKAERAYRHGRIEQTLHLLEKAQHAIRPAQFQTTQQEALTWENVPRFDPALVNRTKWVVESFLVEGNIQLVFGERGSFKSTLILALARAVPRARASWE